MDATPASAASASFPGLSYRTLQWILLLILVLHGVEELVAITVFRPELEDAVREYPSILRPVPTVDQLLGFLFILLVVAGTPIVLPLRGRAARVRDHFVAAVAVGFFINALFQHLPPTLQTRGYTAGLFSAVLLAMPYSAYFVVRSLRERRVSWGGLALSLLIAGAFLVFGLRLIARAVGLQ